MRTAADDRASGRAVHGTGLRRGPVTILAVALVCGAATAVPEVETVYYDGPAGADGVLTGGRVEMALPEVTRDRLLAQADARGSANGNNRLDLVFVGDGYTAGEMGVFHADAAFVRAQLFSYEPFTSYEPYFAVHEIEVVSAESGVDNDPDPGIDRDTALGMRYWCNGIERLLCVDVNAAFAFAGAAPDVDQVIALANSSKYGGAGYPTSNLGTAAGGNSFAPDIVIHELGHALGDLGDEYTYGGPTTYTGPERPERNLSIYDAAQIASLGTKWADWLGDTDPRFDGPVGAFEGGYYSAFGVYRPSDNSMMRSLGRPFNAPSAEALIAEIYREVSPIDGHTPNGQTVTADATLGVTPMQPRFHDLDIAWTIDGGTIAGATGETLDLSALGIAEQAVVRATVTDNTDMVRDESLRQAWMTETVSWIVEPAAPQCPGDTDASGAVDLADLLTVLSNFGDATAGGAGAGDLDGSGAVDLADLLAVLSAFGEACG